jgi:hypothetical protein
VLPPGYTLVSRRLEPVSSLGDAILFRAVLLNGGCGIDFAVPTTVNPWLCDFYVYVLTAGGCAFHIGIGVQVTNGGCRRVACRDDSDESTAI